MKKYLCFFDGWRDKKISLLKPEINTNEKLELIYSFKDKKPSYNQKTSRKIPCF